MNRSLRNNLKVHTTINTWFFYTMNNYDVITGGPTTATTCTCDVLTPAILLKLEMPLMLAMLLALAVSVTLAIYSHTLSHHPTQSNQHLLHSRVWHRALASDLRVVTRLLRVLSRK